MELYPTCLIFASVPRETISVLSQESLITCVQSCLYITILGNLEHYRSHSQVKKLRHKGENDLLVIQLLRNQPEPRQFRSVVHALKNHALNHISVLTSNIFALHLFFRSHELSKFLIWLLTDRLGENKDSVLKSWNLITSLRITISFLTVNLTQFLYLHCFPPSPCLQITLLWLYICDYIFVILLLMFPVTRWECSQPLSELPSLRILEWISLFLSWSYLLMITQFPVILKHRKWKWKWSRSVMTDSLQPHGLYPTWLLRPWDSPPMGFSRQEYWSGLPFPSPGDLPNPGIEPRSPTLQADALTSEPPGNSQNEYDNQQKVDTVQ